MFDGSELLSNCLALMPLLRESPGPIQSPKHTASSLIHIPLGTYPAPPEPRVASLSQSKPSAILRLLRSRGTSTPTPGDSRARIRHDNTVGRSHLRIRPWASSPPRLRRHLPRWGITPSARRPAPLLESGAAPIRRAMALMGAPRVLAVRARPFFVRLDAFLRAMHLPAPHTGFGQQLAPVHLASVHECPIA
ncbi:hypothetical protein B0H14DRAFT_3449395 [Mycena olivaceomarginata]|nr:hypothetical protein B0H14DRAFT_3449395 [Mycena olivaceomarginata]